jgi:hypothetical protein
LWGQMVGIPALAMAIFLKFRDIFPNSSFSNNVNIECETIRQILDCEFHTVSFLQMTNTYPS